MRLRIALLLAVSAVGFGSSLRAELCTIDAVPAATLLLPYFEVDTSSANGMTTLFSVNNAVAEATLAKVTLWTDYARPTLNFDVYLTGYDVQTFNVRDLLNGLLPQTATASQDPTDAISPQGPFSEDGDFLGCPIQSILPPVLGDSLIRAHQGLDSPAYGGCVGYPYADSFARGYITVDVVTRCSVMAPSDGGYFTQVASRDNRLWGTYFYLDPSGNAAQQETLVHIEACEPSVIGVPPPGSCGFGPGDYTFYGRYVADAADQREPLPSTFAASYVEGGAFDGGTRLAVWRDTKSLPPSSGRCGGPPPILLDEREVFAFDEMENPVEFCRGSIGDPPTPPLGCFNLASQKIGLGEAGLGEGINPPAPFGWLFLNLSHQVQSDRFPGRAQAWVTTVMTASGRFSVATDAVALDDLCSEDAGQGSVVH